MRSIQGSAPRARRPSVPPAAPVVAVLLLSLAFGPATPSAPDAPASAAVIQFPSEKDRWIQVQTAHFTLFSNASEKESREIGVRFERMRSALSTIGDRTEVNSPTPTWIYVFKDEASFRPYQPQAAGSSGGAAGHRSVRRDGNYAALSVTSGLDAFLPIFHELTHDFLRTNLPDLPAWLDEGIAACYATFRADDKAVEIGRPY